MFNNKHKYFSYCKNLSENLTDPTNSKKQNKYIFFPFSHLPSFIHPQQLTFPTHHPNILVSSSSSKKALCSRF